ncbi:MAG TPA: hypothetical protein VKM55_26735 [Candidatus Lokiarchaeia archaeon]|nr:hypothetical protein [Candidatus Lokiarchaeia archaeon]
MSSNYGEVFAELQEQNPRVDKGCVLSPEGDVLFIEGDWDLTDDGKQLLQTWLEHGSRLEIQAMGYSILRSEPEQLVSSNVIKKESIVGSITRDANYFIAHLAAASSDQVGRDYLDVARAAAKMQ